MMINNMSDTVMLRARIEAIALDLEALHSKISFYLGEDEEIEESNVQAEATEGDDTLDDVRDAPLFQGKPEQERVINPPEWAREIKKIIAAKGTGGVAALPAPSVAVVPSKIEGEVL